MLLFIDCAERLTNGRSFLYKLFTFFAVTMRRSRTSAQHVTRENNSQRAELCWTECAVLFSAQQVWPATTATAAAAVLSGKPARETLKRQLATAERTVSPIQISTQKNNSGSSCFKCCDRRSRTATGISFSFSHCHTCPSNFYSFILSHRRLHKPKYNHAKA